MADEVSYQLRRLIPLLPRLARLEEQRSVKIVQQLPDEAPAHVLLRTTTSRDLYMGNGPGRPLSRFPEAP